jgi:hypothetical protein
MILTNEAKIVLIVVTGIVLIAFAIAADSILTGIYAPSNPVAGTLSLIDRCVGSNSSNNLQCTQIVLNAMKDGEHVQH